MNSDIIWNLKHLPPNLFKQVQFKITCIHGIKRGSRFPHFELGQLIITGSKYSLWIHWYFKLFLYYDPWQNFAQPLLSGKWLYWVQCEISQNSPKWGHYIHTPLYIHTNTNTQSYTCDNKIVQQKLNLKNKSRGEISNN